MTRAKKLAIFMPAGEAAETSALFAAMSAGALAGDNSCGHCPLCADERGMGDRMLRLLSEAPWVLRDRQFGFAREI